ncbi:MAG: hypothetical protein ACFFDT_18795, partial [Candidatus Hodarchaeota archaeon]
MRKFQQNFFLLILVFFYMNILLPKNISRASIIWSDDFSDGNYDGWTIGGYNGSVATPPTPPKSKYGDIAGSFSVENGVLTSGDDFGDWTPNGEGTSDFIVNWANFPSVTSFGTWKFDLNLTDSSVKYISIRFIANLVNDEYYDWIWGLNGYDLFFGIEHGGSLHSDTIDKGIYFLKGTGTWYDIDFISYVLTINPAIYKFIITRDNTGFFDIYLNESLLFSKRNTEVKTSTYFRFISMGRSGIDNISVSNTIDFDKAPPHLNESIPLHTIEEGQEYEFQINVTDPSGIDHWWLETGKYDN